jgi:hypothetical protein
MLNIVKNDGSFQGEQFCTPAQDAMVFLHATPALSIRAFMVISPSIVRSASPRSTKGVIH